MRDAATSSERGAGDPWPTIRRLGAALAIVAAIEGAGTGHRGGRVRVEARPCANAVAIDGRVTCDHEAPATLQEVCGPTGSLAPIRAGDAIHAAAICEAASAARGDPGWGRMAPETIALLGIPVNLNEASAAELATLPGIGPVLAGRVIEGRPYERAGEVRRVKGIGPKKMAAIRGRAVARWD